MIVAGWTIGYKLDCLKLDSSSRGTSQSCGDRQVLKTPAVDSYITPTNSIALPSAALSIVPFPDGWSRRMNFGIDNKNYSLKMFDVSEDFFGDRGVTG
ncbi:unnamed protein product [Ilex paraguariensis]|uniref:Uncharacterized protein n=1 Tax=Ilex paraguariensis TaxID=185542 RepID=A0ABC8QRN0_9AQUA